MRWTSILIIAVMGLLVNGLTPASAARIVEKSAALPDSSKAEMQEAVNTWKSLDRSEKKARLREAKSVWRNYKKAMRQGYAGEGDSSQVLLIILGILVPPLAIYLKERTLGWPFWASIGLLATGLILFSALPIFWILAAGLALLVVFEVF